MVVAERLLTVEQIADELQVNIETVRRWLRSKALRGVLLSRQAGWRVTREDLERFIDSRRPDAPGHP